MCKNHFASNDHHYKKRVIFTWFDILRIVLGVVLFSQICYKIITGGWWVPHMVLNSTSHLSPNGYWSDFVLPHKFTTQELSEYSGDNTQGKPVLLAIKGKVFDVTKSNNFYGSWGPYKKFTGKDCSVLFGIDTWDLNKFANLPCSSDITSLTPYELERIHTWVKFYEKRYPYVGYIVD